MKYPHTGYYAKAVAVIVVFFIGSISAYGQKDSLMTDADVQQIIDDIFGSQDLELNYDQLYENLMLVFTNPINLNQATTEQLRFLGFLSEFQINSLIDYRTANGNLLTLHELQAIHGFDLTTINRLIPFVTLQEVESHINKSLLNRVITNKNNYTLLRYEHLFEEKSGFKMAIDPGKRFMGSPDRLYLRYRNSRPGDFSIGFTFEKDAGESIRWEPMKQVGFDFFSFHGQVLNKGKFENLIVGDYQVQAGQGLVLGGLFGIGKGGETITAARRSNLGGLPYTSSYENGYLRGLLATFRVTRNFHFTGFISSAKRDAALQIDSLENYTVSALQTTGLHRSKSELNGRDVIDEANLGAIVSFKNRKLDTGLIFNTIDFSLSIEKNPTAYNQFAFNRTTNHNISVYLNYNYYNFTFFNEAAKTLDGGAALISGLLGSVTPQLDIAFLYRNWTLPFYTGIISETFTHSMQMPSVKVQPYKMNQEFTGDGNINGTKNIAWLAI